MFKIKKHRRARDRWKVQARATDAAARLREPSRIAMALEESERITGMSEIVSLADMDTQPFSHETRLPKGVEVQACVMVVLAKDPKTGRSGALISGHPSMDYFFLQDLLSAGDTAIKNLIRHTNPPKQDLSHIIVPGEASLANLLGR